MTLAPIDGRAVEFWTWSMSRGDQGILGWFERGEFLSLDRADRWGTSEVRSWCYMPDSRGMSDDVLKIFDELRQH